MEIGISLGSNLGDRLLHLQNARRSMACINGLDILTQAPVYETEPVDVPDAFRELAFLNTVLIVEYADPLTLLPALQEVEYTLGRRRDPALRNGPRPIDIDIIYAGMTTLNIPHLVIPHPFAAARRFVLQPLVDVRPELRLPGWSDDARDLLLTLPACPNVVLFAHEW